MSRGGLPIVLVNAMLMECQKMNLAECLDCGGMSMLRECTKIHAISKKRQHARLSPERVMSILW